jgi:hypothetical protein
METEGEAFKESQLMNHAGRKTLSPGSRRGGEDVRAAYLEMEVRAKDRAKEPRAKGDADLRYPA